MITPQEETKLNATNTSMHIKLKNTDNTKSTQKTKPRFGCLLLETEWDYSCTKGRDGKNKKVNTR